MSAGFVHLHIHSEYSIVNGIVRVKPLIKAVADYNMPAVAITDQCNLFCLIKFYRAALASGVKPIIGVDVWVYNEEEPSKPFHIVLLCQNSTGYGNLTRLVSRSYTEGQQRGIPMIKKTWLSGKTEGLIALSGGLYGDIGQSIHHGKTESLNSLVDFWQELFPDRFYLELHRTGRAGEEDYLHQALSIAQQYSLPVVATNDVHFLMPDDYEAHEARVCINEGRVLSDIRRQRKHTEQQYLRSPEEMMALFSDIPEALQNTLEIAKRCNVELDLGKFFLPDFPIPKGSTLEEFFRQLSKEGLEKRLRSLYDITSPNFSQIRKPYDERLDIELDVIMKMGFSGYFLIVADFIQWAKDNDIPVGPGRGSGAGSVVAYALTITDLDPLEYELLFERFLNPERLSMPDFDVDFCMDKRDKVIEYVANRYGREKVSQIITYGTMAAKAVVRDVGRVLGNAYPFVDKIAKLIPFEIGITLDKALEQTPELRERYEQEEEVQTLINLARKLEGITRNAGKHAGGVVIAPSELTDFSPLFCEESGGGLVTQFDKDDVETVGLVKFDFLGLRTLTIVDWAVKAVNEQLDKINQPLIDISAIDLTDKKTFRLLKAHQTTAVFQLESRGMKDLIKRLQPDSFEDIIALVALFRPGPLQSGMVDDFINRKHGRAKVEYPHPDLEPILKPTYGVILYQEQVMQIAQVLAGYTLGGADMLRRAMGKKKPEEMAKQRTIFVTGSTQRGIDEAQATYIFDLMEKFAGYGFNKSHSAAYALISYQTAWLKAHYPAPFMAAVTSSDMDNTDKVVNFIEEVRDMDIGILEPDVNGSHYYFKAPDNKHIRYGLGAIKGVGEAAILSIVNERVHNGIFKDIFDFCKRVDLKKLNRRSLETLIRSGAMDKLGPNRASIMASLSKAIQMAEQHTRNRLMGQNDMFGLSVPRSEDSDMSDMIIKEEWEEGKRLESEKESLGLYLTGHPMERFDSELAHFVSTPLKDILVSSHKKKNVVIAGLVSGVRTMKTKRGDTIAFLPLEDRSGRIELTLFSGSYEKYKELLVKDNLVIVCGESALDAYSGNMKVTVKDIMTLTQARSFYAKQLTIKLDKEMFDNNFLQAFEEALSPYKNGSCPINIQYTRPGIQCTFPPGNTWKISPTEELLHHLKKMTGPNQVTLEYT